MIDSVQIAVVVAPAPSYDLVDLKTVKTLLDITDASADDYFRLVIPQASDLVVRETNNRFVVETLQESFYLHRETFPWQLDEGVAPLQVSRWPVISIASVVETVGGNSVTLVEGVDFILDGRKGQLTRLDKRGLARAWHPVPTVVTYQAGYASTPPSVVRAVVEILKGMYFARKRDPNLRNENIEGVYQAAYWFGGGPGSSGALPPAIADALDDFRVPVAG